MTWVNAYYDVVVGALQAVRDSWAVVALSLIID
jgi:hypothetical protein